MLVFFSKKHWKLYSRSWFLSYAAEQGISREAVVRVCTLMENRLSQHRIIDAERLLEMLKRSSLKLDVETVQSWLRLTGWKIQGTDGVRGIVSPAAVGVLKSLRIFIEEDIITQTFCNLYARAWGKMLYDLSEDSDRYSMEKLPALKIVLAEDGRDYYGKTGLKQSIIQGFFCLNISVIDLGIVPTPALAAYSLKYDLPGVMLTASHNAARYNGIKLFRKGQKLYPDGAFGEYLLSWYIFSLAEKKNDAGKKPDMNSNTESFIFSEDKEETDRQIERLLYASIDKKALHILRSTPLLLDTANGAYTKTALHFFLQQKIEVIPVGCNPGINRINSGCGVALLENLDAVLHDDDTHPYIVRELFRVGRLSGKKKIFGIVLDGDGDRGFLLEYDSMEDTVYLYNGDAIGYIIVSGMVRDTPADPKPFFRFVSTVESDPALTYAVEENLHIKTEITCVGDRWLLFENSIQKSLLLGCERSGHVIVPVKIDNNSQSGVDKVVYTGNGLSTSLAAISNILNFEDDPISSGHNIFLPGYRSRVVIGNCKMDHFYRDSKLWKKVEEIVQQIITSKCKEKIFIHEMDMLYFDVFDLKDKPIGRWYMRKSGTEPKISFCLNILAMYTAQCSEWMKKLKQRILPLLEQDS